VVCKHDYLTHTFAAWSTVVEKLNVPQFVMKFPASYATKGSTPSAKVPTYGPYPKLTSPVHIIAVVKVSQGIYSLYWEMHVNGFPTENISGEGIDL
jgi:hypothetical protein